MPETKTKADEVVAKPVRPTKETYYFVGNEVDLGGQTLHRIGQTVALFPADVPSYGRVPLLTQKEFSDIGFSPDELKQWGPLAKRRSAPESFLAKLREAQRVACAKWGGN